MQTRKGQEAAAALCSACTSLSNFLAPPGRPLTGAQLQQPLPGHYLGVGGQVLAQRNRGGPEVQADEVRRRVWRAAVPGQAAAGSTAVGGGCWRLRLQRERDPAQLLGRLPAGHRHLLLAKLKRALGEAQAGLHIHGQTSCK